MALSHLTVRHRRRPHPGRSQPQRGTTGHHAPQVKGSENVLDSTQNRDPQAGDPVILRGHIFRIEEGIAVVEVYQAVPVGLRVPVQCGALEYDELAMPGDGGVADTSCSGQVPVTSG